VLVALYDRVVQPVAEPDDDRASEIRTELASRGSGLAPLSFVVLAVSRLLTPPASQPCPPHVLLFNPDQGVVVLVQLRSDPAHK
jgi:hypothetical protein